MYVVEISSKVRPQKRKDNEEIFCILVEEANLVGSLEGTLRVGTVTFGCLR